MENEISKEDLAIFNYLERNRLHSSLSIQAKNKVDQLIRDRNVYISKYCSGDYTDNNRISMHVDFIKNNNEELKKMLHII